MLSGSLDHIFSTVANGRPVPHHRDAVSQWVFREGQVLEMHSISPAHRMRMAAAMAITTAYACGCRRLNGSGRALGAKVGRGHRWKQ